MQVFFGCQQIEQEGGEVLLVQLAGHKVVPGAQPAASASVRKQDNAPRRRGNDQVAGQFDPAQVDSNLIDYAICHHDPENIKECTPLGPCFQ